MPNGPNTNTPPSAWPTGNTFLPDGADSFIYLNQMINMQTTERPKILQQREDEMTPLKARAGFTFGCDPELFIYDDKGRAVPAEMIPGTKARPHKVPGGAIQRDGFAAELNIDPVTTYEAFSENIDKVLQALRYRLPKGYTLKATPAVVFDEDVFNSAPEAMKDLGCLPDFNAWDNEVNPPPSLEDNPRLRCIGGHLHVGFPGGPYSVGDVQHVINCCDLVKQFDWFLGAWSLLHDNDPVRRKLYGRAGACRIKEYGVEYRVLSSFWVLDEKLRVQVWNRMQVAIGRMAREFFPDQQKIFNAMLIESINKAEKNTDLISSFPYPIKNVSRF